MSRTSLRRLIFLLVFSIAGAAVAEPGYFRYPALHDSTLVFVAEGDLWTVPLAGGEARRLTTHLEEETHPSISPDGEQLAFTAAYDGPRDVYVMPLAGGLPKRLTYEGGVVVGWTPKGEVLFSTRSRSPLSDTQIATVDPEDGSVDLVPLSQAATGVWDPSMETFFFTRQSFQGSHAKRYKGGTAEQLWSFTPPAEAVALTSDYPGTSKKPMWWEGRVYFASDRDGTMNLWSSTPDGGDLRKHTEHVGWDLRSPQLESGRIVYQLGADIHAYHIASDADRKIEIRLTSDFEQSQERWIDGEVSRLDAAQISPDGSRVVLTMRGEVFVAPTKKDARLVHVSRASGVRYRIAYFLDDDTLVALSDQSGEVDWWTLPADGMGEPEPWTTDGEVLRMFGLPSPDGEYIAHADQHGRLWISKAGESTSHKIVAADSGIRGLSFSLDSRWLAYSAVGPDQIAQIFLYEIATKTSTAVTSLRYDSYEPAFSRDGEWLYFLSDRRFRSEVSSPWGPRQPDPYFKDTTEVFALALKPDAEFPFRRADEVEAEQKKAEKDKKKDQDKKGDEGEKGEGEKKDKEKDSKDEEKSVEPIEIVLDGIETRLRKTPAPAGRYGRLRAAEKSLLFMRYPAQGWEAREFVGLKMEPDAELEKLADGIYGVTLSADGKKVLLPKLNALYVVDAAGKPKLNDETKLDLSAWKFSLDPREEWRQMMRDAWRLHRDYFYDAGMHGVDWPAMLKKYSPLVDRVTTREELNDLLAQMVSEISALHTFVRGGDAREGEDEPSSATLGASLRRDEAAGGFRVEHIYQTDPDRLEDLAPFAMPDTDVRKGDVIVSINGVPTLERVPGAALRGLAGEPVRLRLSRDDEEFDEIVRPITTRRDYDLRYDEWEYTRRLEVEESGEGKIGYVHLRAMGASDIGDWMHQYYPVFRRQGLILDMRHNRGGNIDSWILGKLMRQAWFYWKGRSGEPYWNMQYAFRGHMVVLCDEWTASDGEAFTEGFRRLGLGEVIGKRTWGGEIWLTGSNRLMDGGVATAAEFGVYGPEGAWLIEGHGVEPDIVVDNPPHATFQGEDAQLEAAIEYLQKKIAEDPRPVPPVPEYPDLSWEP